MTTFVASIYISLDGCSANDASPPDADEHQAFNDLLARSERIVCDRADYETLVPFWDEVDLDAEDDDDPAQQAVQREFARIFRATPRTVVAPDLERVDPKAELILTDPIPPLTALHEAPGGPLMISAGAGLITTLLAHHLLDELYVLLRPVLIGSADSPFAGLLRSTPLTLLESRALPGGTLVLRYRVASA